MRVAGDYAGPLRSTFPTSPDPNAILLQPFAPDSLRKRAYFPGELVTAWLGADLGGPYLWQFFAGVPLASAASFTNTAQTLDPAHDINLGDLDHDGDLDIVTWNSLTDTVKLWSNDGRGNFDSLATLASNWRPLIGDFDGDGDLDLAGSQMLLNQNSRWVNDFDSLGAPLVAADLDGDGDLDLFVTGINQMGEQMLRNDGAGHFTATTLSKVDFVTDVKAGDMDNDGDLDLVALLYGPTATSQGTGSSFASRAVLLINDGAGNFKEVDAGLTEDATRTVALGDLDGDGDLDVFMASWGARGARNPVDQVWLNDGLAHFTTGDAPLSGSPQVILGDLDGDGDLDAIAGQHDPYSTTKGQPSRILLNDGTGRFSVGGELGGSNFQHVRLGDLDGDGDLDAVVVQWDYFAKPPVQVWLQQN